MEPASTPALATEAITLTLPGLRSSACVPMKALTSVVELAFATAAPTAAPIATAAPMALAETSGLALALIETPPFKPVTLLRSPMPAVTSEPSCAVATAPLAPASTPPAAPNAVASTAPSERASIARLAKPVRFVSAAVPALTRAERSTSATTTPAASAPAAAPMADRSTLLASFAATFTSLTVPADAMVPAMPALTACSSLATPTAAPTPTRPRPPAYTSISTALPPAPSPALACTSINEASTLSAANVAVVLPYSPVKPKAPPAPTPPTPTPPTRLRLLIAVEALTFTSVAAKAPPRILASTVSPRPDSEPTSRFPRFLSASRSLLETVPEPANTSASTLSSDATDFRLPKVPPSSLLASPLSPRPDSSSEAAAPMPVLMPPPAVRVVMLMSRSDLASTEIPLVAVTPLSRIFARTVLPRMAMEAPAPTPVPITPRPKPPVSARSLSTSFAVTSALVESTVALCTIACVSF